MLRSGSRKWPPKYQTLNEAKTEKKVNVKTGRVAQHFRCASCGNDFPAKEVEVDHINPIANAGQVTWDEFIHRLYCEQDNLQVLCKEDHKKKTKEERARN